MILGEGRAQLNRVPGMKQLHCDQGKYWENPMAGNPLTVFHRLVRARAHVLNRTFGKD